MPATPAPPASSSFRALASRLLLHVVLPLAVGLFCYAAWRSAELHLVALLSRLAPGAAASLRGIAASRMPALVLGSLPDLAWAWAFGASLALVWRGRPWREKVGWLAAGGAVAIFAEAGQAIGVVPGTFDVADLVAIAAGFVLGARLAGRERAAAPVKDTPDARATSR